MEKYLAKDSISGEPVYTLEISSVTDNQSGEIFYMVTSKSLSLGADPDWVFNRFVYPTYDRAKSRIECEMEEQAFFHVFSRI